MAVTIGTDIDMNKKEIQNGVVHTGTSFPASPIEGQLFYRTDLDLLHVYDGSSWRGQQDEIWTADVENDLNMNGNAIVGVPSTTHYWSCSGHNFKAGDHGGTPDEYSYQSTGAHVIASESSVDFVAPVFLPHGAVITSAIVYGNISDETWHLDREALSSGTTYILANGNFNSSDSATHTVNNSSNSYWFYTSSLDSGDEIYGARITYTLPTVS